MSGKGLLRAIEWISLSGELLDKHSTLFSTDEVAELSSDDQHRKEAVNSAMKRIPQRVLHAFYKSLWDTRDCGGALHHAGIAKEIKKQSECACVCAYLEHVCEWQSPLPLCAKY